MQTNSDVNADIWRTNLN